MFCKKHVGPKHLTSALTDSFYCSVHFSLACDLHTWLALELRFCYSFTPPLLFVSYLITNLYSLLILYTLYWPTGSASAVMFWKFSLIHIFDYSFWLLLSLSPSWFLVLIAVLHWYDISRILFEISLYSMR